jgi:hypothetical protein
MQRIAHGSTSDDLPQNVAAVFALPGASNPIPFGYLFPDLQNDPDSLLPELPDTLNNLALLGATMLDPGDDPQFNSRIPSAYTYLGQFIDHDIAFTKIDKTPPTLTDSCALDDPGLRPWSSAEINAKVTNQRRALLQLDCVYGAVAPNPAPPRAKGDDQSMAVGMVTPNPKSLAVPGKDVDNDLVRTAMSAVAKNDRVAMIGDPRNDQNLIVSQLHVAFLRAHNAIVKFLRGKALVQPGHEFREAQRILRQHYHWMVLHDFLKQIADPDVVDEVLANPNRIYPLNKFFLPLEFTVAAYRFGHGMIRSTYYLNNNIPVETLARLFTLTALSDDLKPTPGQGFRTLPDSKVIQWRRFIGGSGNKNVARQIRTRLVEPLFSLLDATDQPVPCERRLAVQDLKRGYMMRIPTGQAVARALGIPIMPANEIEAVAADNTQLKVLQQCGFSSCTPLWFYCLAEAAHSARQTGKSHLGPVASRLVAEVIIGLIRASKDSILASDFNPHGAFPMFGKTPGEFTLPDLLQLAGVLEA